MRKDHVVRRTVVVVVSIWVILTGYKLTRKILSISSLSHSMNSKGVSTNGYYTMPKTKEERRNELGRSTWTLLHTVAAKYPVKPTREDKTNAIHLIDLLTKIFPCEECRGHFKQLVQGFPPKVSSQEEFSTWMCEAHNIVNRRLNKPVFDCRRLDDRWDCGCK